MLSLTRAILVLLTAAFLWPFSPSGAVVNSLIVHEWGTFTSVSTADGKAQYWDPLSGPSELPGFVYSPWRPWQDECPKCGLWLVRMETPVLYFYPAKQMDISVRVDFPQGRIIEWYPQAQLVKSGISWSNVALRPGEQATFPNDQSQSHYYPARDTDGAPVRSSHAGKPEWEKFLFYRGIGNFDLPLTVGLCSDRVEVSVAGHNEVARMILFENRGGKLGWSLNGPLNGSLLLPRPALDQSRASLERELQSVLVSQGLYEKEAAAMIRTWQDSWFEEGLRLLYVVPRKLTDTVLPLAVTPEASDVTRVFVGRVEIITPEMEADIEGAVRNFREPSDEARTASIKTVRKYGRFAGPVLLRLREAAADNSERSKIMELKVAAAQK